MASRSTTSSVRFGDGFEFDLRSYELKQSGLALRLERIPSELLLLLIQRRGDLVTRDEIVEKIWGKDVFLDTDKQRQCCYPQDPSGACRRPGPPAVRSNLNRPRLSVYCGRRRVWRSRPRKGKPWPLAATNCWGGKYPTTASSGCWVAGAWEWSTRPRT